jgi:hypothetical protein
LQLGKDAYKKFKFGILHYHASMQSSTNVPMDGLANIASIFSSNQDEDVRIESIYYRDHQHMNEVMLRKEKDEKASQVMKQSMDLLPK